LIRRGVYITFTTLTGGDIVVTAYANPSFFLKASYSLRGPVNFSGSLCVARNSTTTCYYPINTTLSIPPGTYTLSVSRDDGEGHILYWYPTFRQETTVTKNFFHTSFEETDGNSTSGDAITGKYSRTGGYTTTLSDLVAGNYILSYWKKQGAGWEYNESTVSVPGTSYDINLTGQVDEVRFYPVDAQMITYTYEPLVGMTSKCDENNRITYYLYDGFGRLSLIKDENNNVLKKICYNYAGQPEECDCMNYSASWQNTSTPLRCQNDLNGSNTGNQEQEQTDINPCSATYDQTRWVVTGFNEAACPLPPSCTPANCSDEGEKCINNTCETGIKIFTASYDIGNRSFCTYHYEWSDGSWSQNYTVEIPFGFRCALN